MGFLQGKTAIITGAGFAALKDGSAGSIGFGIATAFAKEGCDLVITGRNMKKLEAAKEKLESEHGIEVLIIAADVNAGADNAAVVQNVIDQTIEKFGRIDVLVNNAQAFASGVTLSDHTTEQFDLAMYSGLLESLCFMKACHPHLKDTGGSVINFAPIAIPPGNFGQYAYAAAQEGIRGLARAVADEWGSDGISVNAICSIAWTTALGSLVGGFAEAFEAGIEEELGCTAVRLASPDLKHISGEVFVLEGCVGPYPQATGSCD